MANAKESVSFAPKAPASASFASAASIERSAPYSRTQADLPPGDSPRADSMAGPPLVNASKSQEQVNRETRQSQDGALIMQAQQIFTASTDYLNANVTNDWERNLAHFHNEHASGTQYRKMGFKRSKTFRPMTRANVKAQEASMSVAVFSTNDMVDVQPQNPQDEMQAAAAPLIKYILQNRLEERMPWFQTVMGAWQDTKVYGVCITFQNWDYHEDTDVVPQFGEDGEPITNDDGEHMGLPTTIVRRDELACDNVPPENFRFDPSCDWRDPARSSNYLVYVRPMTAADALEMMEKVDPKTQQPVWRQYEIGQILSTRKDTYNRTRQAREGRDRIDTMSTAKDAGNEFSTVWAHLNIVKVNGTDMAYWTMGTDLVLTDPRPLRKMFPWLREGERPFVVGTSTIETHRNYPDGDVGQGAPLQEELNTVVNQRLDNVKLVLNKRYFVRRGSQTDLDALMRNVPGGGVMMNDIEKDVKVVTTEDVTSSGYQEQDRIASEFDNLVGNLSPASVMSNKKMGDSVGGMSMLGQSANSVQDYSIRIFLTTWMQPAMRQLVRLVQMYENDETLIALGAAATGAFEKFGDDPDLDKILLQGLTTRISIGMGNTDPVRRVERLTYAVEKVAALPGIAPRMKSRKIADQIFGALGWRDGAQFVMNDEEWEKDQQENPPEPPPEIAVKMRELDIREQDNNMRNQRENQKLEETIQLQYAELAFKYDKSIDDVLATMENEKLKDKTKRDIAALNAALKHEDMNLKRVQAAKKPPTPPGATKGPPKGEKNAGPPA